MELFDTINSRFSNRKFLEKQISDDNLNKILKAVNIDKDRCVSTWTDDELIAVRSAISGVYKIEGDSDTDIE